MPQTPLAGPATRAAAIARGLGLAWIAWIAWGVATGPLTHGFAAYLTAARVLDGGLLGGWVYDDARFIDFVQRSLGTSVIDVFGPNPPAMALLFWPVAAWTPRLARGAWLAASIAAWWWTVRPPRRPAGAIASTRAAWLAVALLVMAPVWATLRNAQVYLVVAAVLAGAAEALRRGRPVTVGALVGAAVVTKTAGLALLPMLVARRQWRALGAATAVTLVSVGATLRGDGVAAWLTYPSYVRDFAADPRTMVTAYQSTSGLVRHLCVADARWNPSPAADCAPAAWLVPLALLLVATWVTLRLARRDDADPRWGLAAALTLSVLLVPAAEEHQFVQLAAPALLAMSAQRDQRPWWPWLVLVALLHVPFAIAPADVPGGWWAITVYPRLAAAWWLWGLVVVEARTGARDATSPASA